MYASLEGLAFALMHPRVARIPQRVAERNLVRQVKDPALRAALTPHYTLGCKRILYSNNYLPALQRANVRGRDHVRSCGCSRTQSSGPTGSSARSTRSSSAPAST